MVKQALVLPFWRVKVKYRVLDYLYILATIIFTVYGQLILKWRIGKFGSLPSEISDKFNFFLLLFLDPAILSGFAAAFLASLTWMAAMTKFELSYAYPFMSLNFVLVMLLSTGLLGEPISVLKAVGVGFIIMGTVVVSRA
jgi:uncharacterized membrane protein